MRATLKLTDLEAEVAWRLRRREDPWDGAGNRVGSRTVSAALGRMQRKGAADYIYVPSGDPEWVLTPAGSEALDARESK